MGQGLLSGCQVDCTRIISQTTTRQKSQIYFANLASHLPPTNQEHNYLTKSVTSLTKNNHFLVEIKDIPSQYIEFINNLYTNKAKFFDKVFVADANAIIWGGDQNQNDWARLTDMSEETASIYRGLGYFTKSKIIQILEMLQDNIPQIISHIKPIYIPKVGLAICTLYINGVHQDVVVDDLIPTSHLRHYNKKNSWHFLVEKAFAKILGNYEFIEEFSLLELFQEMTGMPYEISKSTAQSWKGKDESIHDKILQGKIRSFKEVIQIQNVYCLCSGNANNEVYCVRSIKDYTVKSFIFDKQSRSTLLFKIMVDADQKASIRMSYLNLKYESAERKSSVVPSQLKLYKSSQNHYILVEKDMCTIGNCVYLGCPFLPLQKGEYLLMVKRSSCKRKASLVNYIGEGVTFKQIQSKQICKQILSKIGQKEQL